MSTALSVKQMVVAAGLVANQVASRNVFADYQQRKSANSLAAHRADLQTFSDYLSAVHDGAYRVQRNDLQNRADAWEGVTWGLVAGFVQWMLGEGLALSSVNRKLSTVKVYAGLAAKAGMIDGNELALIKTVKGYASKEFKKVDDKRKDVGYATRTGSKKAKGAALDVEQAKALKAQPDTPQGRRDALMMTLLLDHGLRVGELVALQVTDINLAKGIIRFYRPKVDKTQTHKLSRDAKAALWAYLPDAPALGSLLRGSLKSGELSAPKGGGPGGAGLTRESITRRVGVLGAALGIDNLSAHDCRHFWATHAVEKKVDPFRLMQAGGWTSMATVKKYVEETEIANEGMVDSGD